MAESSTCASDVMACRSWPRMSSRFYELVAGRLAKPDAEDLLKAEQHDTAEAEKLRTERATLLAELDNIGVERADGLLTGKQAKIATDRLNEKLAAIEARQQDQDRLRVLDGIPLGKPGAAAAVKKLSPDRFRAVVDLLMMSRSLRLARAARCSILNGCRWTGDERDDFCRHRSHGRHMPR